jgi:hypothetical protein
MCKEERNLLRSEVKRYRSKLNQFDKALSLQVDEAMKRNYAEM